MVIYRILKIKDTIDYPRAFIRRRREPEDIDVINLLFNKDDTFNDVEVIAEFESKEEAEVMLSTLCGHASTASYNRFHFIDIETYAIEEVESDPDALDGWMPTGAYTFAKTDFHDSVNPPSNDEDDESDDI